MDRGRLLACHLGDYACDAANIDLDDVVSGFGSDTADGE